MDDLVLLLRSDISRSAEESANLPDFTTIAHRGALRRRRRTLAAVVAAAVAVAALLGSLQLVEERRALPAAPPSTTLTPTTPPKECPTGQAPDCGPITSAEKYLAAADAGGYQWRSFDAVTDKGLYVSAPDQGPVESVTVVGARGPLATLTCARELQCSKDDWLNFAAALGPGADEVTVASGDRTVQVVGYDGSVRRALDLRGSLPAGHTITKLAWSPNGNRLAVLTSRSEGFGRGEDLWLSDAGGAVRLAYSAKIWDLGGWSPDGQSLLVDVYVGQVGADVVQLRLQPDGSARPVTARTLFRSGRHFDWAGNLAWSPDGTRIAVRDVPGIDEISAEDGTVLARHPHIEGWLIWPRSAR